MAPAYEPLRLKGPGAAHASAKDTGSARPGRIWRGADSRTSASRAHRSPGSCRSAGRKRSRLREWRRDISGGTPERRLARSSSCRCASQNSVPSRMRRSVKKIGRYSYQSLAFSAGRVHGLEDRGLALRGARAMLAQRLLLERIWSDHSAMKALTSARCVSIAAAGAAPRSRGAAAEAVRSTGRTGGASSRADQLAVTMERHEDPEARKQRDHGSAAVADQGQRHADHRQDAAHHA